MHYILLAMLLSVATPAFAGCELEGAELSIDQLTWNLGDDAYKLSKRDQRAAFEQALSQCVGRDTWESYYLWRTWQTRGRTTVLTGLGFAPAVFVSVPMATVGAVEMVGPAVRNRTSFEEKLRADLAAPPATPVSVPLAARDQEAMRRQRVRGVVIPVASATFTASVITVLIIVWDDITIVNLS